MLFAVHEANKKLESSNNNIEDLAVMSMDAAALFPSLKIKDILQGLWRLVMDTTQALDNIDIKEIAKYIAVIYDEDEHRKQNIISCLPRRQVELDGTHRRHPTLAYLDTDTYTRTRQGIRERDVPKWNWDKVRSPS